MCGIFCLTLDQGHGATRTELTKLTRKLLLIAESRGREAAGVCAFAQGKTHLIKQADSASNMVRSAVFDAFSKAAFAKLQDAPITITGHARLVTNGMRAFHKNNQPFEDGGFVGIHNGIVVNVEDFLEAGEEAPELDSVVIGRQLRKHLDAGLALDKANAATLADLRGVASYILIENETGQVFAGSNNGSLYEGVLVKDGASIGRLLMSESSMFKQCRATLSELGLTVSAPRHYAAGTCDHWLTGAAQATNQDSEQGTASTSGHQDTEASRISVVDLSALPDPGGAHLTRCTKCLLPHTMPFIDFDDKGECNWCRHDILTPMRPRSELDDKLAQLQTITDRPNCLMAVSGGRDSCYGLHIAKTQLGLNPIAFTYDWGMVTDLARRNTSRICEKLGIEHIIVSADIPRKRENIRLNIEAWLKRPELGMVPVFTAGDKQFYQHANRLQKELDLPAIIFCENGRYEKTWFKAGFAGMNEGRRRLWNLSVYEKTRYLSYYVKQFLLNPAYFNRSILDSAEAFISSYFLKHDYIQLFDYIQWDEKEVEETLINEYGFEVPEGCPTTWRIGDGTAPFYNFIYYTVAGFTEFDTFRSNQIRDGRITREFGEARLPIENEPRMSDLKEYLATVGVNFDKAVTKILSMKRLY